jgi:hypothetical protein
VKTAQQAAANWAASSGRAATNWTEGVQAYSGDWAGATVRQQAVMQTNWQQAVSSGRWASGVQNTGTNGWKTATAASGGNFTNGFTKGAPKQAVAIGKIMNFLQSAVPALPARGDINANLARSNALALALHQQKGNLGA